MEPVRWRRHLEAEFGPECENKVLQLHAEHLDGVDDPRNMKSSFLDVST
jgi:hypothetical protein